MLTIIFIFLILAALCAIAYVVVPKLPLISSIEVEETPPERWKRIKKSIIIGRLARKARETSRMVGKKVLIKERREKMQGIVSKWQHKLRELELRYKTQTKEQTIMLALKRGREMIADNPDEAEQKFLEAVRLDPRNLEAYEGLLEIYWNRRSVSEAEEIGRFLMKLNPGARGRYAFKLADAFFGAGDTARARKYADMSIAEEPENPKYLDFLIELAIIGKDVKNAAKYLKQLKKVNPENAKIEEWEERIVAL